jgi:formylmethanofuran dehydrogenase subunit A
MTADGPVGHYLARLTGRKWVSLDVEHEDGCGIVPITYDDRKFVHALQWAMGLEWFLLVSDPWRIALSTDHPNGGAFRSYPEIIALLMSRDLRREVLGRLPRRVRRRCGLGELTREYTLSEIAIITRAGPARMLGLARKGHLGVGADADITIYAPDDDRRRMFALPRYVIKGGVVVVDDSELRSAPDGQTLLVAPEVDPSLRAELNDWLGRHGTIHPANFAIADEEVARPSVVAAPGGVS